MLKHTRRCPAGGVADHHRNTRRGTPASPGMGRSLGRDGRATAAAGSESTPTSSGPAALDATVGTSVGLS